MSAPSVSTGSDDVSVALRTLGPPLGLVGVSFLIRWAVGGMLFWASLPVLGLLHSHAEGAGSARQRVEGVLEVDEARRIARASRVPSGRSW